MADEFAKGFGVLTVAGLGWMVLSGWYTTPGFEEVQLVGHPPENLDAYGQVALLAREALFWFAVIGALTFWVVIPAINRYRGNTAEDSE
jgi:hypothetical protein